VIFENTIEKNVFKIINSEKKRRRRRSEESPRSVCSADLEDSLGKEQKPY